ncbi:MAG: 50S ribosomal protein L6 [Proteobacteria bacterium]|nr:50S ribosomal protein L6 [Pseudomonadota bacterium]
MSRVGNKPVEIPKGVSVSADAGQLRVKGPRGELARPMPPEVKVTVTGATATVERTDSGGGRRSRAMHGLGRALLQNMVTGVSKGFTRTLEINGVGYRADARGGMLALLLGHSHPIEVLLPAGITAKVEKSTITLESADREQLGQLAAVVRAQRGPEPYKGKGIKFAEETIRRKVGKAGAA